MDNDRGRPVVALLPLDERPVNVGLVRDVANIAGVGLATPPTSILSDFRTPADTDALGLWLTEVASDATTRAVVVSADMLVHGGLIPARTSVDEVSSVVARLDVLRAIRVERPDLPLSVVSLITRASDSYSNVEEPDYWSDFGRELHGLGGSTHRRWAGAEGAPPSVPDHIRQDFALRRLRNHIVNLTALSLRWEGVIDHLALTADDTAEYSAGSAEQEWLRYWQLLRPAEGVAMHPGADETGAVLVARALAGLAGVEPTVTILPGDAAGMNLVPSYENQPLALSLPRHIASAGGRVSERGDVALVVHTADPGRADHFSLTEPVGDARAVALTVDAVRAALENYAVVALADLRYGNGADALLIESLAAEGLLWRLSAYGGWNTAGNAAGSVIALAFAEVAGRAMGSYDSGAAQRALARRILDDYAYQSIVRREVAGDLFGASIAPVARDVAQKAAIVIRDRLSDRLRALDAPSSIVLDSIGLPWLRSFEVDVRLAGDSEI